MASEALINVIERQGFLEQAGDAIQPAVSNAAHLGGHLVYGEQIGVDHTAAQEMPKEFVAVLPEGELSVGEMKKVDAEGAPVLLVRRNGEVNAIAHTCSHMGGPLSEGNLDARLKL